MLTRWISCSQCVIRVPKVAFDFFTELNLEALRQWHVRQARQVHSVPSTTHCPSSTSCQSAPEADLKSLERPSDDSFIPFAHMIDDPKVTSLLRPPADFSTAWLHTPSSQYRNLEALNPLNTESAAHEPQITLLVPNTSSGVQVEPKAKPQSSGSTIKIVKPIGKAKTTANKRLGTDAVGLAHDRKSTRIPTARQRPANDSHVKEPWQIQKRALQEKFVDGWAPRRKLSPDALDGIRALHTELPGTYTTPVLSQQFQISPESIRRILKSKWKPSEKEAESRRRRWETRGQSIWTRKAELGLKPPRKWRQMGVGKDQISLHKRRDQGGERKPQSLRSRTPDLVNDLPEASMSLSLSKRIL